MAKSKKQKFDEINNKYSTGSTSNTGGAQTNSSRQSQFDLINKKYTVGNATNQYNPVNDYNEVRTLYNKVDSYRNRVANGEYLTAEDLDIYQNTVTDYLARLGNFRQKQKELGAVYTQEEEDLWGSEQAQLAASVGAYRDMYSDYADEAAWQDALASNQAYLESLGYDIEAGKIELNKLGADLGEAKADAELAKEISRTPFLTTAASVEDIEIGFEQSPNFQKEVEYLYNKYGKDKYSTVAEFYYGEFTNNSGRKLRSLIMGSLESDYNDLENYIKQAEHNQEVYALEEEVKGIAGFATKSKYDPTKYEENPDYNSSFDFVMDETSGTVTSGDWTLYAAVNGDENAKAIILQEAMGNYSPATQLAMSLLKGKTEMVDMTDEEIAIFNAIAIEYGPDKAAEYYNLIQSDLYERNRYRHMQENIEYANEHKAWASLGSIALSPLKGISYIGQTLDYLDDGTIDENAPYNAFSYTGSDIRGARGAAVNENVAGVAEWVGAGDAVQEWTGKAGEFGYNLAMSMGDFVMATAVSGGNQAVALGIMGTGAAADATIAAKQRGLDDSQAFALGTMAGAAEIISEKIGWDALFDAALLGEDAVRYLLKNALSEGLEEPTSTLINTVADIVIAGDQSELSVAARKYMEEGMSTDEAWTKVMTEYGGQLLLDSVGGVLSGAGMGGGAVLGNTVVNTTNAIKTGMRTDLSALQGVAGQYTGNKAIDKASAKAAKKGNAYRTGNLYNAVASEVYDQTKSDFTKALRDSGIYGKAVDAISTVFTDAAMGYKLSNEAAELLDAAGNDPKIRSVYNQVMEEGGVAAQRIAQLQSTGKVKQTKAETKSAPAAKESPVEQVGEETIEPEEDLGDGTFVISSNETVQTIDVAEISEKKTTVTINGKSTVPLSDVSFANDVTAAAFDLVTSVPGMTAKAANVILNNPNLASPGFMDQAIRTFEGGVRNDQLLYTKIDPDIISPNDAREIFNAGREAAAENAKAKQEEKAKTAKKTENKEKAKGKTGGVFYEYDGKTIDQRNDGKHRPLNKAQRVSVDFAKRMAKKFGATYYFYESYIENGKRVYKDRDGNIRQARKGFYDPADGSIHVDLNGEHVLYTISHELVHFIKDWSPVQFQKMADLVMSGFNKQGLTSEELIANKQAEYAEDGIELTDEEAFEEVIAAALEGIMADGRVMELIRDAEAKDKSLGGKIKQFFQDIAQMIRDTIDSYKDATPGSAEGRLIRKLEDVYAQLQEIYAEAVYDAGKNFQKAENTTGEGGVRYSVAGEMSETADMQMLAVAKKQLANGVDPEAIRKETGWFKGYDGEWRYEISDKDMEMDANGRFHTNPDIRRYNELVNKVYFGDGTATNAEIQELQSLKQSLKGVDMKPGTLGQLIKHDALFYAYPQLKDIPVKFADISERGRYSPTSKTITIRNDLKTDKHQLGKTLVHEIQHAIQDIEGFTGGSSTEYWRNMGIPENKLAEYYEKTAGEIEARDVAKRKDLSDEARKENRPDIDRTDVVLANSNELSYSKHGNRFFKENVFPPYKESKSDAHEWAERWARSEDTEVGDRKLASYHKQWYLIEAFSDMKYGYQIVEKIKAKDYERVAKYYGTLTGYESLQDSLNENAPQYNGRSSDGDAGYRANNNATEYGRKNTVVYELGENQIRRGITTGDSTGNSESSSEDSRWENRPSLDSDFGNPDIRYSVGRKTDKSVQKALEKENEKLREDVAQLKEMLKLQGKETHGLLFTQSSITAAARYLKKLSGAGGDTKVLAKQLDAFYQYIAAGEDLTWENVREQARPIANWLMDHVEHTRSDYAQEVLDQIHGSRVYLDETQMKEAEYSTGSYNEYRKSLMGSITISKNAEISLDSWWHEMSSLYPDVFDENVTASDMPAELANVIYRLRNENTSALEYEYNRRWIEQDLIRDVYDSYWRVSNLRTVADRNAKKITSLKIQHNNRINNLKAENRQKIEQLKEQHRAEVEIIRNAYRQKIQDQRTKIMSKYQESRSKAVENRKATALRRKIKKLLDGMRKTMLHPTDGKYIPANLFEAMVRVLETLDTDTDLYKEDGSINKSQQKRNEMREQLRTLRDEYRKIEKHEAYATEFDDYIMSYLTDMEEKFSGKKLKDLSLDEAYELCDILKSINDVLSDARKMIGFADAEYTYEVADAVAHEQAAVVADRKNGKRNFANKTNDKMQNFVLSPVRNVERMSGYAEGAMLVKVMQGLEQGVRDKNIFVMESYKMFEDLSSSKANKKIFESAVYDPFGKKYTDTKGKEFRVSKMQMMQAILSYEREQANKNLNHIESSGFMFADLDLLRKGKMKNAIESENAHSVPAAVWMVSEFNEALENDSWAQNYMRTAREFFDGKAKKAVNDAAMATKHRIIAKDKSYIPFEVNQNDVYREVTALNEVQKTISGYGMLQETKNKAPQALIITGLNNVIDRHIEQVGTVYGLTVPVRNFNKVWNTRAESSSGRKMVKEIISDNWGADGAKHIEAAVRDIQGPRSNDNPYWYKKIRSNYIGATFALNASVVTKQVGSLFSAKSALENYRSSGAMLANLVYTMVKWKSIAAEVDQYTASAWVRRRGMSDTELSKLMTEGKKSLAGKIVDFTHGPDIITAMDHAVALSLWKYCKKDVAKRTGFTGEKLLQETAKHFDNVVENTQSMADVLHRPEVQKTSNPVWESFSMFKTDMYQMSGQLNVTAGRYFANPNKKNGKALARTVLACAESALWGQLMTSLFAIIRYSVGRYRDDEEDITAKSWRKRLSFDLIGDVVGYVLPLFGSELVGIVAGLHYGETEDLLSNMSMDNVNKLYSTIMGIVMKLMAGKDVTVQQWRQLAAQCLGLLGVPANNIMRILNAVAMHAKDIASGQFLSFEQGVERSANQYMANVVDAYNHDGADSAADVCDDALEDIAFRKAKGEEVESTHRNEARSDLRSALGKMYRDGKVTKESARRILMDCLGEGKDDAEDYIRYWDLKLAYPKLDITKSLSDSFYEYAEPYGISINVYVDFREKISNVDSDKDSSGKPISGSKKKKIVNIISAMSISATQKRALYLSLGYAESDSPW